MAALVALMVVVLVILYAGMAGLVGMRFYQWRTSICPTCQDPGPYRDRCYQIHNEPAVFAGALWPLLLPILAGVWGALRDKRADRLQAEIQRLERELGMDKSEAAS